ncbi:MAG: hypothetical protein HUK16_08170, partial [Bacteroidales bacterium]|nr:hypothetical protein [Bacteroidales bacterium]
MLYKLDNQNVFVGTPLNATIPWSADNITVGDFNGDNLSDIMYVLDGDVVFLLTRPDSDIVPFGYPILQTNLNVGETKVLLMGDFDGDKHQAVMMITEDFVKVFKLVAHKDNGVVNYSVENVTYLCNPFSEFVIPSILPNPSVRFLAGDYNGDAKTDILVLDDSNSSGEDNWCFYFSMGNGLFEEVIRAKNDKIAGYNLFVNDLNDDGCSDVCCIIRGSDGSNSQYGNTSHYYWYRRDYHIQPVHNHVDIYKREPLDTYKTLEWDENQQDSVWITHSVPIPFDVQLRDVPYSFEDDWNVGFGNFTGGSSSQVLFCRPLAKGGQMYIKPVATCYPEGKVRHVIDTIIDGFGARRVINYTTVACQVLQRDELEKGSDRNSFNPVRLYYGNLAVVNNMCFEAEQNDFSSANTDYYFINPRFDTHGRGMIGFDRSVTIERFKTTRKEFTYNNVYHFMVPLRVENITDDGDRVVENYEYGFMQLKKHFPLKCFKPFLARVEKQYVHDEITYKTEIETISKSDIDNYGNVLKTKREYGGNGGHVVSYKKYLNKLNVGDRRFLGLVTSDSTVYALVPGETPVVKCVNYEYDKVTCRMIKKVFEKDSPNRLDETYTYDNFGNMLSKKAISEGVVKSESMTYCPKGIFMLSKTDALGHVTSFTYHKIRCLLAADTDPNGLTTIYHYNTIGELDKVTRSDGTQQMMAKRWLFGDYLQHPYNPDKQRVAYYSWSQETNGPMRYAFYDHHQNKLRDVVINNEGDYIDDDMTFVDYEYDYSSEKRIREGFVFKKSVPYLSTLLSFEMDHVRDTFNPPPIMPELRHWYQYKYDSSDRLVLISRDDGYSDEQHWYGGLSAHTRSFDGQNKQVHYLTNGLVDSVIDNNGCYLKYRYYADGSVKSVTINGDPTTTVSYTYDNYGNLATMIDPSLDTVVYQYDAFGNLLHYTDSKGTTDYEYDLLGRMTHRSNAELDTRWEWDPENAIGQLSCARQENRYGAIQAVVDEYKYDELGRLKEQAQTIKGEKLSFKYAYNANGKLKSTTYPSGLKITNTYDGCGSLVKIRRNGKPLWEAKKINAYGTLNEFVANGEIVVRKTFDTITGDVTSIEALTNSLNSFFLQNYSWDEQCGNMASRIDKIANLADHFGYDAFNRLESIATRKNSALLSQTNLTYNPYGNIIAKDGVGSYDYAGDDNPYSINTLSDVETLGNFAEEQRAIYTTFNKLSELTQNDKHLQIAYGPDDQRVWQEFTTPKESKQKRYFTQLYETVTENGVT